MSLHKYPWVQDKRAPTLEAAIKPILDASSPVYMGDTTPKKSKILAAWPASKPQFWMNRFGQNDIEASTQIAIFLIEAGQRMVLFATWPDGEGFFMSRAGGISAIRGSHLWTPRAPTWRAPWRKELRKGTQPGSFDICFLNKSNGQELVAWSGNGGNPKMIATSSATRICTPSAHMRLSLHAVLRATDIDHTTPTNAQQTSLTNQ